MPRGYEVVADVLVAAGVGDLFGVMGEGNLELITDLQSRCRVRYHAARHENGALGAAHGYAQAGDRLGVATVTHGPGLTNALTALVSAARLAAPVLLIVGDVAQASDGHVQAIEHEALIVAAGAPLERARSGRDARLPSPGGRSAARTVERRTVVLLVARRHPRAALPCGRQPRRPRPRRSGAGEPTATAGRGRGRRPADRLAAAGAGRARCGPRPRRARGAGRPQRRAAGHDAARQGAVPAATRATWACAAATRRPGAGKVLARRRRRARVRRQPQRLHDPRRHALPERHDRALRRRPGG